MATDGFPFRVYAGNAGKLSHVHKMQDEGIHNLVTATSWSNPKNGIPWALDNGAFAAWKKGDPFPEDSFLATLDKIPGDRPPEWVVIPDKVAAGIESLDFSERWIDRLRHRGWPLMLAVQDGMTPSDIEDRALIDDIYGIFVGGTTGWKKHAAPFWRDFCDKHALHMHIGRVGTVRWLLWASRVGADSVDSSSWTRNDRMEILDQARDAIRTQTTLAVEA